MDQVPDDVGDAAVAEKIAAAQSLLPEHSISAIARMVGVSRGTLYAHMDALTGRSS